MYAFIEGRVCEKTTNSLVLEAGGIGYQLNCSMTTLQEAPPMGEKMRCYTYLSVREDAMELFGFATKEEKQLFLSLTGISGVGAKTALGLLGAELAMLHLAGDFVDHRNTPAVRAAAADAPHACAPVRLQKNRRRKRRDVDLLHAEALRHALRRLLHAAETAHDMLLFYTKRTTLSTGPRVFIPVRTRRCRAGNTAPCRR